MTETVFLDPGFNALADATQGDIIARLSDSEANVTDLAAGYDMALSSRLQHLRVLEVAGLISATKAQGRWLAGLNVRRS